ncbi:MAG: hypothetical protein PQJ50_05395 [Spirochaetales bacterium]|nr:hypothetical protein [Spirochaetales bacterium]
MRKLTILTLLTLAVNSFLYSDEEPIILDKDILYWRPAGDDVLLPDLFLEPLLIQYGSDDYISTLYFPLERKTLPSGKAELPDVPGRDEIYMDWTPPSLFLPGTPDRGHNRLTLYGSYPYGSGAVLAGLYDNFHYGAEANYSHKEGLPHWLRGSGGYVAEFQSLEADLAFRSEGGASLLPLSSWSLSPRITDHASLELGALFHGLFTFDSGDSGDTGSGQWLASAYLGGSYSFSLFTAEAGSGALYESDSEAWLFTPELTLSAGWPTERGDWSLKGGVMVELSQDRSPGYYPLAELKYMDYGSWSLSLQGSRREVDRAEVQDYLVYEVYETPRIERYGYYDAGAVLSVNGGSLQSCFAAGWARGDFPRNMSGVLVPEFMTNIYGSADFSWAYRAGRVTEFSCYADYRDKGSLRIFSELRWIRKGGEGSSLALLLRGGDRDILRGYSCFFSDDSDMMAGAGVEAEFKGPLSTALYLDYLPESASLEGRVELGFQF